MDIIFTSINEYSIISLQNTVGKEGDAAQFLGSNPDTLIISSLGFKEIVDAILFTLSATNGKFICSSTPWSTDSVLHRIFNHPDYKG